MEVSNVTDEYAKYHDFRAWTNDSRPDWYYESMTEMRWTSRVGFIGWTKKELKNKAASGSAVAIIDNMVYDLSDYIQYGPALKSPDGTQAPTDTDRWFMDDSVVDLFKYNAGGDITKKMENLNIDSATLSRQRTCLRNLFLIGKVDNRNSPQCLFSTYILLVLSIIMVSVITFKFLASVNFSSPRAPEDHDKFVICQVPCYTEGEDSLRRTIDSLTTLNYDDKRKLMFMICDGNIIGTGNDRTTPRIVLDILGVDPKLDPEPCLFKSIGEGSKQLNYGKVYSGLYEFEGHVVP